MDSTMVAKIIAFVLYLGFMIYIGLRNASKNNSSSDFFLGGRNVGPWVTALSAEASDSSAWLLMGLPGLCYLGGVKETFWTALGLILGTYLNWLFVAKPLRKCSISFGDSITIPEFFTNRFKDKSHILSVLSVVFIVFFFTIYTASGFVACAKLFNSVFGLPYHAGLAIGLVFILCYTITGGYIAVCTTDFVQGTLIFVAFVISAAIAVFALGGPSEAIAQVQSFDARALANDFGENIRKAFAGNASFKGMSIVSALAWGLGYFGMPHIIVRFMGIRSNDEIKKARRIGTIWMIISYIGTFLIGTLGTAYLLNHGVLLGTGAEEVVVEGVTQFGDAETVFSATDNAQNVPGFHRRNLPLRDSCGLNVNGRQSAFGGFQRGWSGYLQGNHQQKRGRKNGLECEPLHGFLHRADCALPFAQPEFIDFRSRFVRMGRFRRDFRSARFARPLLARHDGKRRDCWPCHGIYRRSFMAQCSRKRSPDFRLVRNRPGLRDLSLVQRGCFAFGQKQRRGNARGI